MGMSAVDELLAQRLFDHKPPPRIHVPFIVHEVLLFLLSWIGLFFLDEPRVIFTNQISFFQTMQDL